MQKILSVIGIGSLTLVLLIALSFTSVSASNVQSPVSESSTSIDPQSTQTKFIEIDRDFTKYPPATYNYNNHGYTGILIRVDVIRVGNLYRGFYGGYVQCTGVCPATSIIE